jgi:hypothetical protein
MHYTDHDRCRIWPDIEIQGLSITLDFWSRHRAVMALVWHWVYDLGLGHEFQALALVLACRVVGSALKVQALVLALALRL